MLARDIMSSAFSLAGPQDLVRAAALKMLEAGAPQVLVVDGEGRLLGLISARELCAAMAGEEGEKKAGEIMKPRPELFVVSPETDLEEAACTMLEKGLSRLPVLEEERPVGCLEQNEIFNRLLSVPEKQGGNGACREEGLIDAMNEGVVVVDKEFRVRQFNAAAEKFTGVRAIKLLGKVSGFYARQDSLVRRVLESGKAQFGVEVQDEEGRIYLTNTVPVEIDGLMDGVLQTFNDITEAKKTQQQLQQAKDDLDRAFSLTLPSCGVEQKLKSTPEYQDAYNRATGNIKVTGVIEDGGYQHVVNALKITADLNSKGLMELLGVEKDILVQAIIYHDLGKSQPVLNCGQTVDPRAVFEDSKLHAERSADLARRFQQKQDDVITLIRYHHHAEEELPEDFPQYLLPMFRLMRVIDGLSAGMTRRGARIGFRVSGSRLVILEHNDHPQFSRTVEVDLYTGQEFTYTERKVLAPNREALPL